MVQATVAAMKMKMKMKESVRNENENEKASKRRSHPPQKEVHGT
jgi:hypothetical protein